MKYLLSLLIVCLPLSVFAKSNVVIDSKVYFKGKKIGSPRITTLVNKKAKVVLSSREGSTGYSLEMIPRKINGKILLEYDFSVQKKNDEFLTRGRILLAQGSTGRVVMDGKTAVLHFNPKIN
ncbi:MAG: hypothetical protein HRT44_01630 [Bdellovibrionales bacterium]|nr:hypothetical protein [Bdellovibrionales bacterium]NQZ17946.1 hypothetical protein [Bdellovibrionales bacterium]